MDSNRLRAPWAWVIGMVLGAGALHAQTLPNGRWDTEPDSPYSFLGGGNYAADATGTNLYMCDSYKNFGRLNLVTNTWTPLASMPYQVSMGRLVVYNGTVYSFGSIEYPPLPVGVSSVLDSILKYSIANDAAGWTTLPVKLSAHGYGASADVVGDKIIITGGMRNSSSPLGSGRTDAVSEFNPVTELLAARAPLPMKLRLHSSAYHSASGKLYVFGGNTDPGLLTTLQVAACLQYTPRAVALDGTVTGDTWVAKTDITVDGGVSSRNRPIAFVINDRIFLAGGSHAEPGSTTLNYLAECLEYRPASNDWVRWADMTRVRVLSAVAISGGAAHLVGGADGVSPSSGIDISREAFYPPGSLGPPPGGSPTPSPSPEGPFFAVEEGSDGKAKCGASSAGDWGIAAIPFFFVLIAASALCRD